MGKIGRIRHEVIQPEAVMRSLSKRQKRTLAETEISQLMLNG